MRHQPVSLWMLQDLLADLLIEIRTSVLPDRHTSESELLSSSPLESSDRL
jgi:hypothetical protein